MSVSYSPHFPQDSVETRGRGGGSARAVRQRRELELTSGGLRGEVTYWKEVSKYRKGQNKELKQVGCRLSLVLSAYLLTLTGSNLPRLQAVGRQSNSRMIPPSAGCKSRRPS